MCSSGETNRRPSPQSSRLAGRDGNGRRSRFTESFPVIHGALARGAPSEYKRLRRCEWWCSLQGKTPTLEPGFFFKRNLFYLHAPNTLSSAWNHHQQVLSRARKLVRHINMHTRCRAASTFLEITCWQRVEQNPLTRSSAAPQLSPLSVNSEWNELCDTLGLPLLIRRHGPVKFCEMSAASENANNLHGALKVREIHFHTAGRFRWRRRSWKRGSTSTHQKWKLRVCWSVNRLHRPTYSAREQHGSVSAALSFISLAGRTWTMSASETLCCYSLSEQRTVLDETSAGFTSSSLWDFLQEGLHSLLHFRCLCL